MFQKAFSSAGSLLLAGAAVFMMAGPGLAAGHGGGGHGGGGGGHGGGGHGGGGGGHFGGGGGRFGGAHFGGYRGGMYHGGANYGGHHYGYGRYRPYYGGYGYYDYYPYSYNTYPYVESDEDVTPSDPHGYPTVTLPASSDQAGSSAATGSDQPDANAHVTVNVPADAQVWFDDTPTTSTGPTRHFDSPPLTAGGRYSYEIRASWKENGREVTRTQKVEVTPGAHASVSFLALPNTAGQAPAVK
jgi:uncharacterized protein (TIGR03000 family)